MSGKRIALLGLAQASGTFLYVMMVVLFINSLPDIDGKPGEETSGLVYLPAVGMLLLFIISACISGALVLGYPAVLALRQRVREAFLLAAATVGWLVLLLAVVVAVGG